MKYFRADLHVHSRFSRATSGRLNIRNLAAWSMIKGLSVMSTGDFTHPAWRDELRRDLVYDDNSGLYRVREKTPLETEIPGFSRPDGVSEPQFLIQAEISSIYKKDGSVRKVHNVVIMPSLESADKLSNKLAAIGNITSDGRPILGLDCEHLLEMVLEADERGVLIPAHIWTPWFSLFGSKSGFDALEDCFGSLSSHIFALETGLSSDPDMNRLWSALDRYALVSNSDAHSGENLGREANLFEGTPSYDGIFDALRRAARDEEGSGCIYRGTVEFFPEEGKYHLDGHRACNVVLEPEESMKIGNICPVCGKPLTVGVLHRVMALADRKAPVMPKHDPGFVSLFPLPEMLGELLSVGPKSRKVQERQSELVRLFGSEMDILHTVPESDLRQHWDALGEAVARMRRGRQSVLGRRAQTICDRKVSFFLLVGCSARSPKTGQKTQSGTFQGTSIETGIPVRGNDAPGTSDAARSEGVPVFRSAAESHPSRAKPRAGTRGTRFRQDPYPRGPRPAPPRRRHPRSAYPCRYLYPPRRRRAPGTP